MESLAGMDQQPLLGLLVVNASCKLRVVNSVLRAVAVA